MRLQSPVETMMLMLKSTRDMRLHRTRISPMRSGKAGVTITTVQRRHCKPQYACHGRRSAELDLAPAGFRWAKAPARTNVSAEAVTNMPDDEPAGDQLAEDLLNDVRLALAAQHEHFYHFTTDDALPSIQEHGVDPGYEQDRSSYGQRLHEPAKAMRFFTFDEPGISAGLSAADARTRDDDEPWRRKLKPVLLRAKSDCLLSRQFGLDYSYGPVREWRRCLTTRPSAAELLSCIREFGVISAYDVIPPYQLELCTTDGERFLSERGGGGVDHFAPLLAVTLANPKGVA